ncbi:ABC transporter ATP-binding protein [Sanguibacter antarcticus]|uniref:ABC-type multidrug transport system ATPase subunit n=1 Tax=Sanguibacter antarcticus TaxID=372484 RepID=A0A2A9E863_9MICO|nr:ABC transporter ATP-binding protein [Sanguibacter antarcticus]PFG34350.1 ABC-type multidrug transport system ATPase subunit [Sanguibacter antarcticus]
MTSAEPPSPPVLVPVPTASPVATPTEYGVIAQGVRRTFGSVRAVEDVHMLARRGSVTALIGPNGSGKTTLMLMLAGLLVPDAGHIFIDGLDPVTQNYAARSRVGWMPDVFGTWDSLTAREVLETSGAAYRLPAAYAKERANELLATVHLNDLADQPAHVLSRGQKQRLGLARALVHNPSVLILDEPANGLDPRSRIELRALVRTIAATGTTVLVSSHILAELDEMVDDAVFVSNGRTVASESVAEARTAHRTWRMRAMTPEPLQAWLRSVAVPFVEQPDGSLVLQLAGEEAASRILRDSVTAGVPVVSLAPSGGALEQTYLSLDEERR